MKKVMTQLVAVSILGATAIAAAQEPSVRQLAPEKTVLLIALKDADGTLGKLKETSLWELWQSEQFDSVRTRLARELDEGSERILQEIGVDRDSLQPPDGDVMLSVFAIVGEELGLPGLGFMLAADYGEHADRTAELFDAAIKKAGEEDDLVWEERDVMGRTVLEFDISDMELQEEAAEEEGFGEFGGPQMLDTDAMLASVKSLFYVREGSRFILSTDLESLRGAFESFDGVRRTWLGQREDFQGVMGQIGEDNDLYAMILMRDLGDIAAAVDPAGMTMMFLPMVKQFLGDVQGLGVGERIGADGRTSDTVASVYMPYGKSGLSAMVDTGTPRDEIPAFVPAGAVSYSRINFEFESLPAFVEGIMQFAGPMMGMGQQEGPSPADMVRQMTAPLGREVHSFDTVERPMGMQSQRMVFAIDTPRVQDMENTLTQMMPQFGLEARDFLGHRLYTKDLAGMGGGMPGMEMTMPMQSLSVGVAGGFTFLGETTGVEQALRAVGQDGNAGLAEEASIERALETLEGEDVVSWGYSDLVTVIELQVKIMLEQARQFEDFKRANPEFAEDLEDVQMVPDEELKMLRELDFNDFRRYVGPLVWEVESTGTGFVGRWHLLPASSE